MMDGATASGTVSESVTPGTNTPAEYGTDGMFAAVATNGTTDGDTNGESVESSKQ
jgi:hypothetical protein